MLVQYSYGEVKFTMRVEIDLCRNLCRNFCHVAIVHLTLLFTSFSCICSILSLLSVLCFLCIFYFLYLSVNTFLTFFKFLCFFRLLLCFAFARHQVQGRIGEAATEVWDVVERRHEIGLRRLRNFLDQFRAKGVQRFLSRCLKMSQVSVFEDTFVFNFQLLGAIELLKLQKLDGPDAPLPNTMLFQIETVVVEQLIVAKE